MTKFLVHIVLHDPESATGFQKLNAQMHQGGFRRELPGKKASYCLPVGSYWYEAKTSLADLRTQVAAVAEQLGLSVGILVVKLDGWSVMRLKKAQATPQG